MGGRAGKTKRIVGEKRLVELVGRAGTYVLYPKSAASLTAVDLADAIAAEVRRRSSYVLAVSSLPAQNLKGRI